MSEATADYALSIKQPWATLVVAGLKTVEVRNWPTARLGRIFIHAARVPDDRAIGWQLVPETHRELAELRGGLIGSVELTGCVTYRQREDFVADCPRHLNDPAWYDGTLLYGFTLANAAIVPFQEYPGWFKFFAINDKKKSRRRPRRLRVSE